MLGINRFYSFHCFSPFCWTDNRLFPRAVLTRPSRSLQHFCKPWAYTSTLPSTSVDSVIMRYNSLFHEPPSPSDAGLIIKTGTSLAKGPRKPAPLILQQQASPRLPPASPALQKQQKIIQPRLPNSQRHLIRKASISTGESSHSVSAVERPPSRRQPPSSEAKKVLKAMPEQEEQTGAVQISSPRRETQQAGAANKPGSLHKNSSSASPSCLVAPRLKAWESYLHWLCLTEEPGTLWASSLCATFHECLLPEPPTAGGVDGREHNATNNNKKMTAAECAARVDDIYWSFYLPLDPLHQCMEDRILSGYLLHVWTMFVELGKRIPHDDPTQDRLVGLLKELVALPPMEVRTWNVSWTPPPSLSPRSRRWITAAAG